MPPYFAWRLFRGCSLSWRVRQEWLVGQVPLVRCHCALLLLRGFQWCRLDISRSCFRNLKMSDLFYPATNCALMVISVFHFSSHVFIRQFGVNGLSLNSVFRHRLVFSASFSFFFPTFLNAGTSVRGCVMASYMSGLGVMDLSALSWWRSPLARICGSLYFLLNVNGTGWSCRVLWSAPVSHKRSPTLLKHQHTVNPIYA